MRSVHFKNSKDEKPAAATKIKPVKQKVTSQVGAEVNNSDTSKDTEVVDDSEWVPSRDWHRCLSDQQRDDLCSKPLTWDSVLSKAGHIKNSEDIKLERPSDKLVDIKLPTVNFCSGDRKISPRLHQNTSLSDLCDGDRCRLAELIQELAKCKQEKQEDEETILMLKSKVAELKTSMRKLLTRKDTESKAVSKIQSQNEVEQIALKNHLSELNQLIYQLQVQKATSEVQLKTIATQAERMTKVIHEMHRENTELQIELKVTKERLKTAQEAVERVSKDLQNVQGQIKPMTVDKACQSVDNFGVDDVKVNKAENINLPYDQHILCELFFNKSLQNEFAPKETVIIIPSDSTSFITKH